MRLLYGRHVGSLIAVWVLMIAIAAGLYWMQLTMPAFIDMMTPLYIVIAIALLVATVRWFRGRSYHDRRHGDRRRHARRDD